MSTECASLAVGRKSAKARSWFYVRAAGNRALAGLIAAARPLLRAMQASNRRKAEQILQQHPWLLRDLPRDKADGDV